MKNFARVMGLLFDSAGAHTYPKSGLVVPLPLENTQPILFLYITIYFTERGKV